MKRVEHIPELNPEFSRGLFAAEAVDSIGGGGPRHGANAIPARLRTRTGRDAAAFYLIQLGRGVLAGKVRILTTDEAVTLPASELVLEIDVKQNKKVNQIDVRLRWPQRS